MWSDREAQSLFTFVYWYPFFFCGYLPDFLSIVLLCFPKER